MGIGDVLWQSNKYKWHVTHLGKRTTTCWRQSLGLKVFLTLSVDPVYLLTKLVFYVFLKLVHCPTILSFTVCHKIVDCKYWATWILSFSTRKKERLLQVHLSNQKALTWIPICHLCACVYCRVFFRRLRKNSNSRKMDQKLKDFFPENSRNRKF